MTSENLKTRPTPRLPRRIKAGKERVGSFGQGADRQVRLVSSRIGGFR